MLPVFVINLDRRPDRWAIMSEQLEQLGIEATRIPAVDARLLAAQEKWEQDTNGNTLGWNADIGAVACAFSHRKTFRAFLDTGEPAALILEDDAALAPDVPDMLSTHWWPPGARVIRLEAGIMNYTAWIPLWPALAKTPSGRTVHRFERWAPGTAAFLISREGAEFLLPHLDHPTQPVDHMFFDHRYSCLARELRALQMVPGAAWQIEGSEASDLDGWRTDDKPGIRRNLQAIPYKVRLRALRFIGKVKKQGVRYRDNPL